MTVLIPAQDLNQPWGVAISKNKTTVGKKRPAPASWNAKAEFANLMSGKPASHARTLALAVELIAIAEDVETVLAAARKFVASATSASRALRVIKRLTTPARKRSPRTVREGTISLLTPAQSRVYVLMLEGLIERDIADRLGISVETVHNHVGAIYKRKSVSSRGQLIFQWAREKGLRIDEVS